MSKKPNSSASKKASDESRLVRKMKQHADSSRDVTSSTSARYLFGRKAHDIQIVGARPPVAPPLSLKRDVLSTLEKKRAAESATAHIMMRAAIYPPPRKGIRDRQHVVVCKQEAEVDIVRTIRKRITKKDEMKGEIVPASCSVPTKKAKKNRKRR